MIKTKNSWIFKQIRRRYSIKSNFRNLKKEIKLWKQFWNSYNQYKKLSGIPEDQLIKTLEPCIFDNTSDTSIEPIYFYQDSWAFELIYKNKPAHHYDIGSHHKFVALLSKVVPLTMIDIRPLSLPLNTINFIEGSIVNLPFKDHTIDSLSSICVVEHIGLGRYGDPLDPEGTIKALNELKRVLSKKGNLYISLPIDDITRTYFNAHRAFCENDLKALFEPLIIAEKKYIYGDTFGDIKGKGFGTGLYHLKYPE
jgi:SAM-dependent methyltransferase